MIDSTARIAAGNRLKLGARSHNQSSPPKTMVATHHVDADFRLRSTRLST